MILGIFTSSPKFAVPIEQLGKMIGLLCNGSTTDFDSVCLGSNPGNPTSIMKWESFYRLPFLFLARSHGSIANTHYPMYARLSLCCSLSTIYAVT